MIKDGRAAVTPLGGFNPPPVPPLRGGGAGRVGSISPVSSIIHSSCSCSSSAGRAFLYIYDADISPLLIPPRKPAHSAGPSKKTRPPGFFGDQKSIKIWIRLGSRLRPKKWPTWTQLGPQDGAQDGQKSCQNRCKNPSKNRCLSRPIFDAMLVDFGRENGGKLAFKKRSKIEAAAEANKTN